LVFTTLLFLFTHISHPPFNLARMTLLIPLILAPTAVLAFGTINTAGQQAEHERVTRIALACPDNTPSDGSCFEPFSMTSFGGGQGTFGAVGSPDGGTEVFEPKAHCDDADYIDYAKHGLNGTYPRSKDDRNKVVIECYNFLKSKFTAGIDSAAELLDENGNLKSDEVSLASNEGKESTCTFLGGWSNRAKCDVYDGLGRALHGVEDFYSHSNWVDDISITPSADNPPGLGNTGIAPFLSMVNGTGPTAENIPDDLSTGCFILSISDATDGAAACLKEGRTITHVVLNKDKGTINVTPQAAVPPPSPFTSDPKTPRGQIGQNFERAVEGAVLEGRRTWADFRTALTTKYGADKANLMICALTRDYPLRDCVPGRRLALVLDSPAAADVGKAITSSLTSETKPGDRAGDEVSVSDAQSTVYPLGDPANAVWNVTSGNALAASVRRATQAFNATKNDGILILATASSGSGNISDLISAIEAAGTKGIRVSHGLITYQPNVARRALRFVARMLRARDDGSRWANNDVATAVLKTGGAYAVLNNADVQSQFAQHLLFWGVTNAEANAPKLYPDVTSVVNSELTYQYTLSEKKKVNATVAALNGGSASVALNEDGKERGKGSGSTVSLQYVAAKDDTVEVKVSPQDSGLFAVSLGLSSSAAKLAPNVLVAAAALGLWVYI
jgi:hypothetical protein